MSNMKKTEVHVRYDQGNNTPALNVKWYPYLPDIIKKFEGVTATSKHLCVRCDKPRHSHGKGTGHHWKPGGKHLTHEFGDDTVFWQWVKGMDGRADAHEYPNGAFTIADEIARELAWDQAKEDAYEVWGSNQVQVYSDGRSGGWLLVRGLGAVEDWDAVELSRWSRYANGVKEIVDDLDSQFIYHLHVNVWENWITQIA